MDCQHDFTKLDASNLLCIRYGFIYFFINMKKRLLYDHFYQNGNLITKAIKSSHMISFVYMFWICIYVQIKLDESTARRQLKSPRSLSGRSIHLTLVTKWSWSWMTNCHPLCKMSIGPPILRYSYFKIWPRRSMVKVMCVVKGQGHVWPTKFKGEGYGQGQTHWSHLRPGVQSICLLFVSWQSDHFWLRYSKFHIWPWKFKVKVMAKVKPDGHIWALEFNRYVCFSFRGNRTIFGWDIANSIFDLENSRSRSWPRSNPMVTFEP